MDVGTDLAGSCLAAELGLTVDDFTSAVPGFDILAEADAPLIWTGFFDEACFIETDFAGEFLDLTTGPVLPVAFLTTTGLFAVALFELLAFFTVEELGLPDDAFAAGF